VRRLIASSVSVTVLAGILASSGIGVAYAYFSSQGAGTGLAAGGSAYSVVLTSATVSAGLYPGGSATVALTVTNPDKAVVRIGGLALDTSQGTGGFAVDSNHNGCGLDVFTFTTQTNGGAGWNVPPASAKYPGTLNISLPSSVTASASTVNACQGAALTVYLKTTP
jgi:hypothetical protein